MDPELPDFLNRLRDRASLFGMSRAKQLEEAAGLRPTPEPFQSAIAVSPSTMPLRCARRRNHRINVGDLVGFVPDLGWCCEMCSR